VESSGRAALAAPSLAESPGELLEVSPAVTGRAQVAVELPAGAGLARYRHQVVVELPVAAVRGQARAGAALRMVEIGQLLAEV
jgi:hypothetical protein